MSPEDYSTVVETSKRRQFDDIFDVNILVGIEETS